MKTTRIKCLLMGWVLLMLSANSVQAQDPRASALASWYLGNGITGEAVPLTGVGTIAYDQVPAGLGARVARRAAQLTSAYWNAGSGLNVTGNAITVYLRARMPGGVWNSGLLAKRGSLATLGYNLFAVDLGGDGDDDIGFEVRTANGIVTLSFPVSRIDATAWHNLVGRYDGSRVELFCNDRLMASAPLTGALNQNGEPTLIGAETDAGSVVRRTSGQIEEAAIWNTALSDAQIAYLNNLDAPLAAWPTQLLHYKHPDHAVGDVHPRWADNRWVLTYMYEASNSSDPELHYGQAQLTTRDFLNWSWRAPYHAPASGSDRNPPWTTIEMFRDPYLGKWRSVWGYFGMRSSLSDDTVNWYAASPQTLMPDPGIYQRFSDPSITQTGPDAWQMVITMGKPNQPIETAGAVGWATSSNLTQWTFRGDLYYPGGRGVPEVPTLFKMGSKWYLLESWYANGVGRPTYQVADAPSGPWSELTPNTLDGKDVCAAVSDSDGARRILFGWIPLTAWVTSGQYWGGHLCFPREVYQAADGTALRTRLPADFSARIRGPRLFPGRSNPTTRSGNWGYQGEKLDVYSSSGANRATLPGLYDRFDAEMTFTLSSGATRAGWLLDWQETGAFAEAGVDASGQMFIRIAGGAVYADLDVPVAADVPHTLRLVVEQDMAELFYDGQFTLAARLPKKLATTSLGLFTDGGPVSFTQVRVHRLKNLEEIPAPANSTGDWGTYE